MNCAWKNQILAIFLTVGLITPSSSAHAVFPFCPPGTVEKGIHDLFSSKVPAGVENPKIRDSKWGPSIQREESIQRLNKMNSSLKDKSFSLTSAEINDEIQLAKNSGLISPGQAKNIQRNCAPIKRCAKVLIKTVSENRRQFNSYLESLRLSRAENAKKEIQLLKKQISSNKKIKVDAVLVGAGPQNGMVASGIRNANPHAHILTLEGTRSYGDFDQFNNTFNLNSAEFNNGTNNRFYGSSIQLDQVNVEGQQFVKSGRMGDATFLLHEQAKSNVVFDQWVKKISIQYPWERWPARYRIETNDGLITYTNELGIGTGLGKPNEVTNNPLTLQFLEAEAKKSNPRTLSLDNFMENFGSQRQKLMKAGQSWEKATENTLKQYDGQVIAFSGKGDGGKIGVELLMENLEHGPKQIVWIGPDFKTFDEFIKADTRPRYRATIEKALNSGKLKIISGKTETISEITEGSNRGKLLLEVRDRNTNELTQVVVDRHNSSSGYINQATQMIDSRHQIELVPLNADIKDNISSNFSNQVQVATQLKVDGRPENIYFTGMASNLNVGSGLDYRELPNLGNENLSLGRRAEFGSFIGAIGRRSEEVGEQIGQRISPAQKVVGQLVPDHLEVFKISKKPKSGHFKSPMVANIQARVELGDLFREFQFNEKTDLITVNVAQAGPSLNIIIKGIDSSSAQLLQRKIVQNEALLRALEGASSTGKSIDAWRANIEIPTRSNGLPQIDLLKIEYDNPID